MPPPDGSVVEVLTLETWIIADKIKPYVWDFYFTEYKSQSKMIKVDYSKGCIFKNFRRISELPNCCDIINRLALLEKPQKIKYINNPTRELQFDFALTWPQYMHWLPLYKISRSFKRAIIKTNPNLVEYMMQYSEFVWLAIIIKPEIILEVWDSQWPKEIPNIKDFYQEYHPELYLQVTYPNKKRKLDV